MQKKSKTRIKRLEKAAVECDKMFSIDKKQIIFIKRKWSDCDKFLDFVHCFCWKKLVYWKHLWKESLSVISEPATAGISDFPSKEARKSEWKTGTRSIIEKLIERISYEKSCFPVNSFGKQEECEWKKRIQRSFWWDRKMIFVSNSWWQMHKSVRHFCRQLRGFPMRKSKRQHCCHQSWETV